ncbi:MAG TPA: hypothetical protein VN915_06685 [Elusimicrobiota bacterium]|nr:hypothetical protein [Elusimicrobiota bacterium]
MNDEFDDLPADAPIELTEKFMEHVLKGCGKREWDILAAINAIARSWPDGADASISADALAVLAMKDLCWTRTKVDLALGALTKAGGLPRPERNESLGGQLSYRLSSISANTERLIDSAISRLKADPPADDPA